MSHVTLDPAWRQVVLEIREGAFDTGELIPHEWLREKLNIVTPRTGSQKDFEALQLQYLGAIEMIKSELLTEDRIYLQSSRGKGYKIVPPGEQTGEVTKTATDGMRKAIRRGLTGLTYVNHGALSDEQKRENLDALNRLQGVAIMQRAAEKRNTSFDTYISKLKSGPE